MKRIFSFYAINVLTIEIDWSYLNHFYAFLKPFLCFDKFHFVSLNILLSAFKHCRTISINGGVDKELTFCLCIMEYLLDYLKSSVSELNEIFVWNVDSTHCSLAKAERIYQRKFNRINWVICVQLYRDCESIIFKRCDG